MLLSQCWWQHPHRLGLLWRVPAQGQEGPDAELAGSFLDGRQRHCGRWERITKAPKQFLWNWQLFCLILAIAWIIIPLDIGYNTTNPDEFEYNSWRVFTALCGVPALLVAISLIWCPESPKFLLSKGRHREALEVFSKIYATNTKKPPSDYPVEKNRNQKSRDKRH